MKKKGILISVCLLVLLAVIFLIQSRPSYTIAQEPSSIQPQPLDGVSFRMEADRKNAKLHVQVETDGHIVLNWSRKQMKIETFRDGSWYPLRPTEASVWDTLAFPDALINHIEFSWDDLLGGDLQPGNYRAIVYYGDGKVSESDFFSSVVEFTVE